MLLRKITLFVLLFFVVALAQEKKYNPLSGWFGANFDVGLNMSFVDTGERLSFPTLRGGLEYFFSTQSSHVFGLRFMGGYNFLKFKGFPPPPDKTHRNFVGDLKLGLIYAYGKSKLFPYLSGGLNYTPYFSKKISRDNIALSFYGEIGAKYLLSDRWSLNLAVAQNLTGQDYVEGIKSGNTNDSYATFTLGLGYAFFSDRDSDGDGVLDKYDQCPNTPFGVKVDKFGCPVDSDGDGVADYLDKCPNTPKGVKVDKDGCPIDSDGDGVPDYLDKCPNTPANVKVDKDGCPVDSDGDGVPDDLDKCPNTPAGVQVDRNGCPVDSDGDGVPDYLDKCPDTPIGTMVDAKGCPVVIEKFEAPVLVLESIKGFESGSTRLSETAKRELKKFSEVMKKYPDAYWRIEGHTDSQGSYEFNKKLSQQRADAIKNYLISLGFTSDRLIAEGMGESYPIADNKTKEGREKNRRIVITKIK